MTVLRDDGDFADAPLDGAVVVGLVHHGAVGVATDQVPVLVVYGVIHLSVGEVCADGERDVALLGVVDQNGTNRTGIVRVPGHACNRVAAHRRVEGYHASFGRTTRLHEEPVHGHVGDIGSHLGA